MPSNTRGGGAVTDGTTITVSIGLLLTLAGIIYAFAVKYCTKDEVKEREKEVRLDISELSARCDRLEASLVNIDKTNAVMTEQLRQLTQAVNKLDTTLEALNRHILLQGAKHDHS